MRSGWWASCVVLAGCRANFDSRVDGPIGASDGDGDGAATMTDAATCAPFGPVDTFDPAGAICGSWGATTMNGMSAARVTGALEIAPGPTPPANGHFGGCNIQPAPLDGDLLLEVSSTLGGQSGYTNVTYYFDPRYVGLQVTGSTGMIHMLSSEGATGHRAYNATAMRFWRLHPTATAIVVEVSADTSTWTEIGRVSVTTAELVGRIITFGGGRDAGGATGVARIDSLNICP